MSFLTWHFSQISQIVFTGDVSYECLRNIHYVVGAYCQFVILISIYEYPENYWPY